MRAIVLRAVGGPENLSLEELPIPVPGPGEVLVKTEAIGVTFTEAAMRTGTLPLPVKLPAPFGFEAAGVVTRAGEGADATLVGRRVVLMHTGLGSYAEYVAVPETGVTLIPDALGAAEAVAVANYGAVAVCLVEKARLTGEETVLVEVAGSGVGGYVTQLVRRRGVRRIIGTAGSAIKRDHAASLGADEVLDHTEPGWTSGLSGVDVAFHSLGGDTTTALLDGMTQGTGRILLYGFLRGAPVVTAMDLLYRGLTLTGCGGGNWYDRVLAARTEVMRMAVDGEIKPQIDSVLPLADAAIAHQRFDQHLPMGKIILTP
jgi:NADPH:quinone reductase-like Zn-dependent oxidoreductase